MSRSISKSITGYYKIDSAHHDAILSLVAPATPQHKMLDPFAGEGEFLEVASKHWNVTPYANELDGDRAANCVARFGVTQAVRCDVERLSASTGAFSMAWLNPPYDHDAQAKNFKHTDDTSSRSPQHRLFLYTRNSTTRFSRGQWQPIC